MYFRLVMPTGGYRALCGDCDEMLRRWGVGFYDMSDDKAHCINTSERTYRYPLPAAMTPLTIGPSLQTFARDSSLTQRPV